MINMPLIDTKEWHDSKGHHQVNIYQGVTIPLYFVQYNIYHGDSSSGILNTPFKTLSGARKEFDKLN